MSPIFLILDILRSKYYTYFHTFRKLLMLRQSVKFYLLSLILISVSFAQDPIDWWSFNKVQNRIIIDKASNIQDTIEGNFRLVKGILGNALKCDGFTTRIIRKAQKTIEISSNFTIEAWVAPQAYPWNWCAVVEQRYENQRGFYFGIDAEGRIGLNASVNRIWRECISNSKIPFMKWSYIAATFDSDKGIILYINGEQTGYLNVKGYLLNDIPMNLEIARNSQKMVPASLNRAGKVRIPASYSFDGIIDELKIYSTALTSDEIKKNYKKFASNENPELKWRKLPQLINKHPEFGAFYTNLKYDEDWDTLWRVDKYPDIVVTFDSINFWMTFWKGTNYNMNMITPNNKWIADQSAEGGGPETQGCAEHMSDKHNRYSHVRVIENSEARIIIHWRYALTDVTYQIANIDPVTEWGDWADEYYYIYPDGIAVRSFIIHGKNDSYSITEPTILSNPGEKPEDNINLDAVTLSNLKADKCTYSYKTWPSNGKPGAEFNNPIPAAVLCMLNIKSEYKPFYIYEPGTRIIPYGGGIKEIDYSYSHFHARNHWPIAQIPCDGRFALADDRVTSSAITSPEPPMLRNKKTGTLEGRFVLGLTNKSIDELVPFARFWIRTPKLKINSTGFYSSGFDRNERAFKIIKSDDAEDSLNLKIDADQNSPIVNPVFVIKNWGKKNLSLFVGNRELLFKKDYRYTLRKTLETTDLILWIRIKSFSVINLSLIPEIK